MVRQAHRVVQDLPVLQVRTVNLEKKMLEAITMAVQELVARFLEVTLVALEDRVENVERMSFPRAEKRFQDMLAKTDRAQAVATVVVVVRNFSLRLSLRNATELPRMMENPEVMVGMVFLDYQVFRDSILSVQDISHPVQEHKALSGQTARVEAVEAEVVRKVA
jgi:hypothetical protein